MSYSFTRYALLAHAIAGRGVATGITKSTVAYTDGEKIYLPESGQERWLVALVVQSALLACGSLERKVVLQLLGQEKLTSRYLTLEAARAAQLTGGVMPRLIYALIAANWGGEICANAEESLRRAITDRSIPHAPSMFGTIRPLVLLKSQGRAGCVGGPAGRREQCRAETRLSQQAREEDEGERTERSALRTKMTSPMLGETPAVKFLKMLLGATSSSNPRDSEGSGGELTANMVKWIKHISASAKLIGTSLGLSDSVEELIGGIRYPEWNCESGAYRPKWCQVVLYEPPDSTGLEHGVPDQLLRRKLARLGTTYVRHHRQTDGENLDNDALIGFVVDTASGVSGDERVYESKRKTGRDMSAIVLLDASGSTDDQQSTNSTIWEAQRTLAHNIIVALEDLGDGIAAYSFRSFGRSDVRFLRIKDFAERFSQDARGRLHALKPSGYTRLGAAIRHARHLISTKAHTENQLLIVVSDGLPYDTGYENTYAEQDVRHALAEAEEHGVGCVCLSVGSASKKDALERVWGNVGHATLKTPADLGRYAEPLFRSAIRRATVGGSRNRQSRVEHV
jgi:nitric oxide reductase NorD protein